MNRLPTHRSTFSTRSSALLSMLVFLLAALAPSSALSADENLLRIASGRKGFTYRSVYAANLEKLMRGYEFVYLKSEGSGQNLDLLADGKADVAFAQADAYAEKLDQDPARYGDLVVVGQIAPECVYVARRAGGPIAGLDSIATKARSGGAVVAVGDEDSGMAATWSYMSRRVPGLAEARVDHTKGTLALNQLAMGAFDAVGWVTDPDNQDQKMLRAVLANDSLELMPITDRVLLAPLREGVWIYQARTVRVGDGQRATDLQTVCTTAMLFTRKDAGSRLIDKLSDELSLNLDKIVPGNKKK